MEIKLIGEELVSLIDKINSKQSRASHLHQSIIAKKLSLIKPNKQSVEPILTDGVNSILSKISAMS